MKNLIRILIVFFLLTLLTRGVFGQTGNDTETLLQKIADLKELQEVLPRNSDGALRQLYILQHGISFPANTDVRIAGRKLVLTDRTQLEGIADPFYLFFWDFRINQNRANAGFIVNNKTGKDTNELVRVIAQADKKGTEWVITDVKIIPMP